MLTAVDNSQLIQRQTQQSDVETHPNVRTASPVQPHAPTARPPLRYGGTRIGFSILARIPVSTRGSVLIRPSPQIEAAARLPIRKLSSSDPDTDKLVKGKSQPGRTSPSLRAIS